MHHLPEGEKVAGRAEDRLWAPRHQNGESYLYERSGLPLKKFFNTSGLLYKSMELKDKLPQMSEDEMLRLLATDGMLVKRPLLVGDDFVLVGFKESEWAARVKNE